MFVKHTFLTANLLALIFFETHSFYACFKKKNWSLFTVDRMLPPLPDENGNPSCGKVMDGDLWPINGFFISSSSMNALYPIAKNTLPGSGKPKIVIKTFCGKDESYDMEFDEDLEEDDLFNCMLDLETKIDSLLSYEFLKGIEIDDASEQKFNQFNYSQCDKEDASLATKINCKLDWYSKELSSLQFLTYKEFSDKEKNDKKNVLYGSILKKVMLFNEAVKKKRDTIKLQII